MKCLDLGHLYQPDTIDGLWYQEIRFVKREGGKYPGNRGSYPGTNIQEILRIIIHRVDYLNNQIPHWTNWWLKKFMIMGLNLLEYRAAKRHNRKFIFSFNIHKKLVLHTDGHIRSTK